MTRYQQMGVVLSVGALACLALNSRLSHTSGWLITPPIQIGTVWTAVDTPLSADVTGPLGSPEAVGYEYRSPLDEKIYFQAFAPTGFESYREPTSFGIFSISAQRQLNLFGPDKPVRAWVLRQPSSPLRVIMYAWLQDKQGHTRIFGSRGMQQGLVERLNIGTQQLQNNSSWCLIRLYTTVPALDINGVQARRNLETVAQAIYKSGLPGGDAL